MTAALAIAAGTALLLSAVALAARLRRRPPSLHHRLLAAHIAQATRR